MALLVAAVLVAGAAPAAHASQDPNPPWPDVLPPLPVSDTTQPGPVPHCRRISMRCIDGNIRRMRRAVDRYGCDHRAVFAMTYMTLSQALRDTMVRDPHFFHDARYLIVEDTVFANYYFYWLHALDRGRPIAPAWQIAFSNAAAGDDNAAQDMLLGINAHIQRDMPFVIASVGLVAPDGSSRKPDHNRVNVVLNAAYQTVIDAVRNRFDPILAWTNTNGSPADDVLGLEMVKGWREGVWRNAERLVNAKTAGDRQQVVDSIEANAANWANLIATGQVPGYRAQRDAYCATHLHGGTSPGAPVH